MNADENLNLRSSNLDDMEETPQNLYLSTIKKKPHMQTVKKSSHIIDYSEIKKEKSHDKYLKVRNDSSTNNSKSKSSSLKKSSQKKWMYHSGNKDE